MLLMSIVYSFEQRVYDNLEILDSIKEYGGYLLKIDFRPFDSKILFYMNAPHSPLFCSLSDKCFNRFCGQKTPINFDRLLFGATLLLLSESSFSIQGLISISTKLA